MNNRVNRMQKRKKRSFARSVGFAIAQNGVALSFVMGLFMLAITGAYWHANGMAFNIKGFSDGFGNASELSDETRDALANRHINRKFVMGGIHLGMTQPMVQELHPNAKIGMDRAGEPVITIATDNGIIVAWLFSANETVTIGDKVVRDDLKRVYRLRRDEAYPVLSEHQILARYGQEYGRPIEATCSRSGQGDSSRCAYRWWGGDGIALQAIAKKKTDLNGRRYTQLTTIATNTIKSPRTTAVRLSLLMGPRKMQAFN